MADYVRAIGDTLTFYAQTKDPSTATESDADAAPTYAVYEEENGTAILSGTMAKLDDPGTVGFYSEKITLSEANGFEYLKDYAIRLRGALSGNSDAIFYTLFMGRLTRRDLGEKDRDTAVSIASTDVIRLRSGTPTPQPGWQIELMDGVYDGFSTNFSAWNAGTESLTVDPPLPAGAVSTTPDYRLLTNSAVPTNSPIVVQPDATTVAKIDDLVDGVNVSEINNQTVLGIGSANNKWRG